MKANNGRGRLKWKFLTGDLHWQTYGGTFVSKQLHNGDWAYWLVMEVMIMEDQRDSDFKYCVELRAVSPEAAEGVPLFDAMRCCGINASTTWFKDPLCLVEVLNSYGTHAHLGEWTGNNLKKLMKEAKDRAAELSIMFGFAMDCSKNKIGTDGWDMIRGRVWGKLRDDENNDDFNPRHGGWFSRQRRQNENEMFCKLVEPILAPLKKRTAGIKKAEGREDE